MMRLAIVALVAVAAVVSAFDASMFGPTIPQSIVDLQASFNQLDDPPTNQTFYFPCDGLSIKYKQDLDIPRDLGLWFVTNAAFSVNHRINPSDVQDSIKRNMGCTKSSLGVVANQMQSTVDIVYRQNITFPAPPGTVIINGNTLRMVRNVFPARQGDFGWWIVEYYNATSGNRFQQDAYIVDTDYTNFKIGYNCADLPVPMTMDTAREQQWIILRRQPMNWSAAQIIAMKLDAGLHGIVDFDMLYEFPTDQC